MPLACQLFINPLFSHGQRFSVRILTQRQCCPGRVVELLLPISLRFKQDH